MKAQRKRTACVGVTENANSVVLVTIADDGTPLDRRQVALTDQTLPTHPHHHEGSWAMGRYLSTPGARVLSLADAVALVELVRAAALRGAAQCLEDLSAMVAVPITRIAIRECPELPATIEECIADNRAQTMADSIMYRKALADAAVARSWSVCWYDRDRVMNQAAVTLEGTPIDAALSAMGRSLGSPWQAKHKLAAAAALAHLR